MRSTHLALALAASLCVSAPLRAQSTHFQLLNSGTISQFGVKVGPYTARMGLGAASEEVKLTCDDFFHEVSVGEQWDARLTNLGTGAVVGPNNTRFSNLEIYRQAAYLTTRFAGQSDYQVGQIQATIWNLLTPSATIDPSTNYWLTQAQTNYGSLNYNDFWIVTDVNSFSQSQTVRNASVQEFIMRRTVTTTPEPASLILLGTGMLGVFGVAARRKSNRGTLA